MNSFAKFGVDLANSQLQTLRKHFWKKWNT
jgi:hypothetical protein